MTVEVRCPNPDCGQKVEVAECDLGKKWRCRKCDTRFTLTVGGDELLGKGTRGDSTPTHPVTSSVGQTVQWIGRFEVRERLGTGAFGTVYRAHDPQLDREVALKVPHAVRLGKTKFVKRFLNEAKAAARLQHPNIVSVFDAGQDGEHLYIAAAFINGQSLDEVLSSRELDFRVTARIVVQLAEALAYAHRQGIIHRDVKPANVMLDENDEPHLMDFGLARLETSDEKLTRDGGVLGTPAYMPPEQARGELEQVGPASDQYSLGATLYQMLCGKAPFKGPPEIVMYNVLHLTPIAPRERRSGVPRDLETICLKSISKETMARYGNCDELARDLQRWLRDEPIFARRVGPLERLARWSRRNPVVATLSGLVAILIMFLSIAGPLMLAREGRARTQADRNAAEASAERKRANQKAKSASAAQVRADSAAERAMQQKLRAEELLYLKTIPYAFREWNVGNVKHAQALLAQCPIRCRNWEYDYLHTLFNARQKSTPAHTAHVTSVAFNADGSSVLSYSLKNEIKLWSADSGVELFVGQGRRRGGYKSGLMFSSRVSFHPSSNAPIHLSTAEEAIYEWDVKNSQRRTLLTLPGLTSATVSPDGQVIATASRTESDGQVTTEIRLLDYKTRNEIRKFTSDAEFNGDTIAEMKFDHGGSQIATYAWSAGHRAVRIWDTASGRDTRKFTFNNLAESSGHIEWLPDNKSLAVTHPIGVTDKLRAPISIYHADTNQHLAVGRDIRSGYNSFVELSDDGDLLATNSMDNTVLLMDTHSGEIVDELKAHTDRVLCADFSPDGTKLVTGGKDKTVKIWDIENPRRFVVANGVYGDSRSLAPVVTPQLSVASIAPDGNAIVAVHGSKNFAISRWDWKGRRIREELTLAGAQRRALAISADSTRLVTGFEKPDTLTVWNTETGERVSKIVDDGHPIIHAAINSDGTRIVTILPDGSLRFWDGKTGAEISTSTPNSHNPVSFKFSPDGRSVVGTYTTEIKFWDTKSARETLKLDLGALNAAFSPDCETITFAGVDNTVSMWNLRRKERIVSLVGHTDIVKSICYSPSGDRIVTGSRDGSIRVWDVKDGRELLTFKGIHGSGEDALMWSIDGRRVVSWIDQLRIWDGGRAARVELGK